MSFIVLSHNQLTYIQNAIKSILLSIPDNKIEIIICDNFSDDNTLFELSKFNIELKIVNGLKPKNQSHLRNLGMKLSTKVYNVFLDMDDYFNVVSMNNIYKLVKDNNVIYDVLLPDAISQNRNVKTEFRLRNIYLTHEPAIATCQYIVRNKFCLSKNIFWEETKYYWDSEDIYFGLLAFNLASIIRVIHQPYYIHFKHSGSNSDRQNFRKYLEYLKYIGDMWNDSISFNTNKYYRQYFKMIIYNMYTHIKTLKGRW